MKHTPGPWKVMPCPIHKGKHILQDHRWIATQNAEVEYSPYVENDWGLSSGKLICQMRDTTPFDAKLIAAAPDLLDACEHAIDELQAVYEWAPTDDIESAINILEYAINKTTE